MTQEEINRRVLNVAVTAQNILDGLDHHKHWETLQGAWEWKGGGFIEFCVWITEISVATNEWLESLNPQDFPGVFDYEVSYELGSWILKQVLGNGRLPEEAEWMAQMQELTSDFFAQGASNG